MNKNKLSDLINEPDLKIYPIEKAETIPSAWYTEEIIYEFESNRILGGSFFGGKEVSGYADLIASVIYSKQKIIMSLSAS